LIETILTSDKLSKLNDSSPISCLPKWASRTTKVVGPDVGDVSGP
jgi:hypothetical protein